MKKVIGTICLVIVLTIVIATGFNLAAKATEEPADGKSKIIELVDVTIDILPDNWLGSRLLSSVKRLVINGTIVISDN